MEFDTSKLKPVGDSPKFDVSKLKSVDGATESKKGSGGDVFERVNPYTGKKETVNPDTGDVIKKEDTFASEPLKQAKVGFLERAVGVNQVLNQMGIGDYIPVYKDGKLTLGAWSNEQLAEIEKKLESEEAGGPIGWGLRQAVDPLSYITPLKGAGMAVSGAAQAGLSSALAPSTDPKQTLARRALGVAEAAPIGFATGRLLESGGQKISKWAGDAPIKEVTPTTDKTDTVKWIKNIATGKSDPKITEDTKSLANAAKNIGLDIQGKEPKQIYKEIKDWYSDNVSKITQDITGGTIAGESHPVNVGLAINDAYDAANNVKRGLYKASDSIGESEMVNVSGLTDDMATALKQMRAKAPARGINPRYDSALDRMEELFDELKQKSGGLANTEGRAALEKEASTLKLLGLVGKVDTPEFKASPEMISAKWLSDAKQAINEFYVPDPLKTSKDVPYSRFGGKIRDAISKTSPQFQNALSKADKAHAEIERRFLNKTIKKYWEPADHDAFKALTGDRNVALNVDTVKKAEGILEKIKQPSDLISLEDSLPKEAYDNLRMAKFHQVMNGAGLDADTISKNYPTLVKSLGDNDKAIQALDSIKTMVEKLNERAIGNISPAALENSNSLKDRAMRLIIGMKPTVAYALKTAADSIKSQETGVSEVALVNLAKKLKSAQPQAIYGPSPITQPLSQAVETSIGKASQ